MLHPAKIVIMDEPTSSLDEASEAVVSNLFREEFEGKTVIAVAHRLKTIRKFDRVVVMDEGRVVEVGKPDELMRVEGGAFRRLWESQK